MNWTDWRPPSWCSPANLTSHLDHELFWSLLRNSSINASNKRMASERLPHTHCGWMYIYNVHITRQLRPATMATDSGVASISHSKTPPCEICAFLSFQYSLFAFYPFLSLSRSLPLAHSYNINDALHLLFRPFIFAIAVEVRCIVAFMPSIIIQYYNVIYVCTKYRCSLTWSGTQQQQQRQMYAGTLRLIPADTDLP